MLIVFTNREEVIERLNEVECLDVLIATSEKELIEQVRRFSSLHIINLDQVDPEKEDLNEKEKKLEKRVGRSERNHSKKD